MVKLENPQIGNFEFECFWNWMVSWLIRKCDLVKVILKGGDEADIVVSALTFPTNCVPPATYYHQHSSVCSFRGAWISRPYSIQWKQFYRYSIGLDYNWDIVTGDVLSSAVWYIQKYRNNFSVAYNSYWTLLSIIQLTILIIIETPII